MALKTEIVDKENDLVWIFKGDLSRVLLTRKLAVSNAI